MIIHRTYRWSVLKFCVVFSSIDNFRIIIRSYNHLKCNSWWLPITYCILLISSSFPYDNCHRETWWIGKIHEPEIFPAFSRNISRSPFATSLESFDIFSFFRTSLKIFKMINTLILIFFNWWMCNKTIMIKNKAY